MQESGRTVIMRPMGAGSGHVFHSVHVRTEDEGGIHELLRLDPALRTMEFLVADLRNGWLSLYPKLILHGTKVAKRISGRHHTHAFAFRIYGKDALLYEYYRNGRLLDRFSSAPDEVREASEMDEDLEEVVARWENGELSAEEYRERIEGYLAGFEDKVSRAKAEARVALSGKPVPEAVRAAHEIVHRYFRGKNADRVLRELLEEGFPDPADRRKAAETYAGFRSRPEVPGGDPRVYRELLGPGGVERLIRLLRSKRGGKELLRGICAELGITGGECSYQHIEEGIFPIDQFTKFGEDLEWPR